IENYGKGRDEWMLIDDWFQSILYRTLKEVEEEMEKLNFKTVIVKGYFNLQNAYRWYLRRCYGIPNRELLKKFIEFQTLILAPITPHIAEEIWEKLGKKGFISIAEWPKIDESKIVYELEKGEEIIRSLIKDATEIIRLIKKRPRLMKIVIASPWKYEFLRKIKEKVAEGLTVSQALKSTLREVRIPDKRAIGIVASTIIKRAEILELMISREVEKKIITEAKDFIRKELELEDVCVIDEEECIGPKARQALPARPTIILE
ncbi:MAG: leucine--tRNA ligase, partial [Thermoprotei archaeon]